MERERKQRKSKTNLGNNNKQEFTKYLIEKNKLNEFSHTRTSKGSQRMFSRIEQYLQEAVGAEKERTKKNQKLKKSLSIKSVSPKKVADHIRELRSLLENKIWDQSMEVMADSLGNDLSMPEIISCTISAKKDADDKLTAMLHVDQSNDNIIALFRQRRIPGVGTIKEDVALYPDGSFSLAKNHIGGVPTGKRRECFFSSSLRSKSCGSEIIQAVKSVEKLSKWYLEC